MEQGKMTPYLTDVRVPLIVRGPGVAEGAVSKAMVQNTDFAPTAAEIAEASVPGFVDGRSMLPLLHGEPGSIEGWREQAYFEGRNRHPFNGMTTTDGLHHVEYEVGFRELYDLNTDPHQLEDLLHEPTAEAEAKASELSARLNAIENCAGDSC